MRIIITLVACLVIAGFAAAGVMPVIVNPGFEEGSSGWGWYSRAKCTYAVSTENPHSGKQCIVFHDESPLEPEVYGRLFQVVGVLPGTEYELSVWVRGKDVASAIHFTDWNSYTLNIPSGTYDWQKISTKFRTKSDQNSLNIGINVVNLCEELAIDDISLRPIGSPIEAKNIRGWFVAPGTVIGDNAPATIAIFIDSKYKTNLTLETAIQAGKEIIFKKSAPIKPGENLFEWEWNSGKVPVRELECTITVSDEKGKIIASKQKIEKLGSAISADLDKVEARLKDFDALYKRCVAKDIPLDYPRVTRTMIEQFLPLARMDLQKGEIARANWAVGDFNRSLDSAIAEMRAYLKTPEIAPNAIRYKTSKVDIEGLSFIGDRQDSKGNKSRGPVFFCGYGHFGQVRADMPRWPGYGVNIIQIEIGPSAVFPSEKEVNLKPAKEIANLLDQAAKHNVMVNILLSPHYFPGWAYQKWPHLMKGGGGFFGYCVDAPEAKQLIEKFLRTVIPLFKHKPALHSFCLSNEPIFDRAAGCDNTKQMWVEYLAKVHGDIATLNARYKTQYASFSDVPIPSNDQYDAPQFYDYVVFNQERFAAWHKWEADVIHEMAPEVPVHAKIMDSALLSRYTIAWGIDPELFGELSQINGNDNYAFPSGKTIAWGSMNIGYDLQRSLNVKPIFNSENHISPDRSNYYIKPENFRTALWQGATHGQGATTIWVWEKTYDKSSDFYGNVMDRPGCAEAVGRTCLDLNRFAAEVTALQNVKAPVAILWSNTSIARSQRYLDAMSRVYTALNFCGIKIDFISEKQLAAGKGKDYQVIILPNATHLPEASFKSLLSLPVSTQCVVFGEAPSNDPWGNDFAKEDVAKLTNQAVVIPLDASTDKELWPKLLSLLDKMELLPEVRVVDASTNQPVWGVEWLPVKIGRRIIINMVNLLEEPVDVLIVRKAKSRELKHDRILQAHNLLSLGGNAKVRTLQPITPVLAEVD